MLVKHNDYNEPPKSPTLLPEHIFYNDCISTRTKWAAAQYPAKLDWADSKDNSDW